jgi:hypothetical protein
MRWGDSMKLRLFFFCLPLSGCVYAPLPELPVLPKFPPIEHVQPQTETKNGNPLETEAVTPHPRPRDSPPATVKAASQCPSLPLPDPIPKPLRIEIGYGNDKADANGLRLLETYKDLRKMIKEKWHSKPP